MNCTFRDITGGFQCVTCKRVVLGVSSPVVIAECRPRRGLGDIVAAWLSAVGITRERVEAVVGGPCGCPGRQAAMNAAGAAWLGMSPGSTAPPEIDPPTP